MRILSSYFVSSFKDKIINIHPSLLPSFPGLDAQKKAYDYGVKVTGCTVHFVNENLDSGPIILQKILYIQRHWDLNELKKELLKIEHETIIEALQIIANTKYAFIMRGVNKMVDVYI